jgi:hypothetical protein
MVVAGDYSLGSPTFATPMLKLNYQLTASTYSLGSPSFARPPLATALIALHANPYTLGSPSFASLFLRSSQRITAPNYSLGSPTFATPALKQTHRLFTNFFSLGSPTFGIATYQTNFQLHAPAYSLGSPTFATPTFRQTGQGLKVNSYSLGSPSFAFPRLQTQDIAQPWPPTYLTQVQSAIDLLRGFVNAVLAAIPDTSAAVANDALRIGNVLRVQADAYLRGNNIGAALQSFMTAAEKAGATYPGLDAARQYLMGFNVSAMPFPQLVQRGALVMTLGSEAKAIAQMKFASQQDAQAMIAVVRDMFAAASDVGIDQLNDPTIYQALVALAGSLTRHLSVTALQLPRYMSYTSDLPMPSLYMANRIYGDGSRYAEIEAENRIIHPAFCPRQLRVLADV